MLIYDHAKSIWHEFGELSKQWNPTPVSHRFSLELSEWQYSLDKEAFISAVNQAQQEISAGNIYQINLSWRAQANLKNSVDNLFSLYQKLRLTSPAPLSAYLNLNQTEILCSSPELFLKQQLQHIETHPIKGTRPRHLNALEDKKQTQDLSASTKEQAELLMITDLMRNDLGQVCQFGSVKVSHLAKLESFSQVHHLCSSIQGTLRPQETIFSVLNACFPGGSITGAPKRKAIEFIQALETVPRGIYTGAIGYIGFNSVSQFNNRHSQFHSTTRPTQVSLWSRNCC